MKEKTLFDHARDLVRSAEISWKMDIRKGEIHIKPKITLSFEKAFELIIEMSGMHESVLETLKRFRTGNLAEFHNDVLVFNPDYFLVDFLSEKSVKDLMKFLRKITEKA